MAYGINQYGTVKYGEDRAIVDYDGESFKPDLMRYLPHFLDGRVITAIMDAIAEEMGITAYNIYDMGMQILSIDTATHKLSEYERELGLSTNITHTYEDRREIIKAKLRGSGTTTRTMIINAAESFSGGDVDVIEYPEEGYFVVQFIGVKGIPRNMKAFINMLDTIKPAHLAYEFKYTYTTCQMLIDWDVKCSDASTMTCIGLKVYEGVISA